MSRSTVVRRTSGFAYRYLPAYSPDLNPIEPAWAKVKAELRRVAARTVDALHEALGPALGAITRAGRGRVLPPLRLRPSR
jgi:transposase